MITYTLPPLTAEQYAQNALNILNTVERSVPEALSTMLRSDIVLTLSGVRAQTTYIDFQHLDDDIKQRLVTTVREYGIDMFDFNSAVLDIGEDENWWINHRSAMNELSERYSFEGFPKLKTQIDTFDKLAIWSGYIEQVILDVLIRNDERVFKDIASPHHIRFGMLLGYPAEAIISSCLLQEGDTEHQADIKYHDKYDAAWPIYSYGDDVKESNTIAAHQVLWSEILTKVYESAWHQLTIKR